MSASRERKRRQAQEEMPLTEKQTQEVKQAKSVKRMTIAFIIICVVMVLVVAVFAVLNTGIVEKNVTVLTVGEHKITAAEMNYFFVNYSNSAFNNTSSMGSLYHQIISTQVPLDQQVQSEETGTTWADQFLDLAIEDARNTYAIYDTAVKAGFSLDEQGLADIESTLSSLDMYASLSGSANANAYLQTYYGRGCNVKNYRSYLIVARTASAYLTQYRDNITSTEEDLAAYEAKDPTLYNSYDYRYFYVAAQDYYETEEPTDEEKAAALASAKADADAALKEIQENGETALIENAEAYHEAHVADADSETAYDADAETLKADTISSSINTVLADWIKDESRKAGDCEVIPFNSSVEGEDDNVIGYYIVMFLDSTDNTDIMTKDVRHILISGSTEDAKAKIEEIQAQFEENPTQDNFAALAAEHSEDSGSKDNGGLYEAVAPGDMVEQFNDWLFEEDHKPGDYGIIETTYGYHLMYMVGDNVDYRTHMIESDYATSTFNDWYQGVVGSYTAEKGALSWVNTGIYLTDTSSLNTNG